MVPLVGVPETIRRGLAPYREVFCRAEGFEHISRYVTGLILSPNKTLQGIYDGQVWEPGAPHSRRAMHEAVFEAGWAADALMPHQSEEHTSELQSLTNLVCRLLLEKKKKI